MLKYNKKQILDLRNKFLKSPLKPRIRCLIVHGSSVYYSFSKLDKANSDIDIELILSTPKVDDYKIVKDILSLAKIKIECQLRYEDEITNKKSLIWLSDYKIFMYFAYSNGICLIGRNIYKDLIHNIPLLKIWKSHLIQAQISFKDIRKSYFIKSDPYVINKNIMRFFYHICLLENFLDYQKIGRHRIIKYSKRAFVPILLKYYIKEFDDAEIRTLIKFENYYRKERLYEKIFPIVNRILYIFERRLKNKRVQLFFSK